MKFLSQFHVFTLPNHLTLCRSLTEPLLNIFAYLLFPKVIALIMVDRNPKKTQVQKK